MKVENIDTVEIDLLISLREGDQQAFEMLYNRYNDKIYNNILRMVKSSETTQDLLQIVFIKLWHKKESIDLQKSFKSFLYRIAENVVYDYFRQVARDREMLSKLMLHTEAGYLHIDQWLDDKENKALLEKAIAQLPTKRQQIYRLCKLEGHSYDQVSAMLGLSPSTVNDHIVKGTKTVKEYLLKTQYYIPLLILLSL